LRTLQGQGGNAVHTLVLQRLEDLLIELLIEHEMAESTRGQDAHPGVALSGFDSVPERDAEFIGAAWPPFTPLLRLVCQTEAHDNRLSKTEALRYF
jgi:hypothetical protein